MQGAWGGQGEGADGDKVTGISACFAREEWSKTCDKADDGESKR